MKQQKENDLPYYLGFDSLKGTYHFFLNLPNGIGRVLSYASYFYLDKGVEGVLSTSTEVPEEIETELKEYLTGKITYVFKKRRKNSKCESVFKVPRQSPQEVIESLGGGHLPSDARLSGKLERLRKQKRTKLITAPLRGKGIYGVQPGCGRSEVSNTSVGSTSTREHQVDGRDLILKEQSIVVSLSSHKGRPKGSKNKPKLVDLVVPKPIITSRGRPKGSKNRPKL